MAVDNDVITLKLQELNNKANALRIVSRELDRVRTNLINIKDTPDSTDPDKMIRNIDPRTNAKFTDAERQKIYDKALTDADVILA